MEQLLVAGIDSVVGGNLAAQLADKYRVVGISVAQSVAIEGCETLVARAEDLQAIRQLVAFYRPDRVVVCGVAGDSAWHQAGKCIAQPSAVAAARAWIRAAGELGARVTLISSDAVFSGPWMFHTESSLSMCEAPQAQSLRTLEAMAVQECSSNLVVRTHAYGWSPLDKQAGWVEEALAALEHNSAGAFDCTPHATPILATDLADVLRGVWEAGLSGVYHIAGAERANPHRFASVLSEVFEMPSPRAALRLAPAEAAQSDFARGETSLHTRKVRRVLGIAMPMLIDGLKRLREQQNSGFDRRLTGGGRQAESKVA